MKPIIILAALAVTALAPSAARAQCQAQRAHDLGCTLECVRGNSCSNPECGAIISQCDSYFATTVGTRCGEFCRNNRGGTYRSIATCLQQCNSGPMPKATAGSSSPARPGAATPGKATASRPVPTPAKTAVARPTVRRPAPVRPSTYGSAKKPTPAQKPSVPAQKSRSAPPTSTVQHAGGD